MTNDMINVKLAELAKTVELNGTQTQASIEALHAEVARMRHLIQGNGSKGLIRTLENIETRMEQMEKFANESPTNTVSQNEFRPIKLLVYGAVGLMLTAILGAIVALVVK